MRYPLVLYPKFKAFTLTGLPANGYLLFSFLAGGTTPSPLYSDAECTIPYANPVVLDSIGEALIYLLYPMKLALTPPGGDLTSAMWVVDNIVGSTALQGFQNLQDSPGYFSRLKIKTNSGTPNTEIDVDADSISVTDGAFYQRLLAVNLTINCATTGINGLDTGSLANSSMYYVYAIAKSDGTQAGLISLSATAPSMPTDYTYKQLIGFAVTDSSSNFLKFNQFDRQFWYQLRRQVLTAGSATSWTAVDLSDYVPPDLVTSVILDELMTSNASDAGYVGFVTAIVFHQTAAVYGAYSVYDQFKIPVVTSQTLYYTVGAATGILSLWVQGFELDI